MVTVSHVLFTDDTSPVTLTLKKKGAVRAEERGRGRGGGREGAESGFYILASDKSLGLHRSGHFHKSPGLGNYLSFDASIMTILR